MRNKKEVFETLLNAYKSSNNITADTIITYGMLLSDLSFSELKAGVIKCIQTCKYFPSIAEIRAAAQDLVAEVSDSRVKTYAEAWGEVEQNIKSVGYYGKPTWSTPEIEEAVKTVGWIELCVLEQSEVNTMRAQFKGIYNAIAERVGQRQQNIQTYLTLTSEEKKQLNPAESFIKEIAEKKSMKKLAAGEPQK